MRKPEEDRDWLDTVNRTMEITPHRLSVLVAGLSGAIRGRLNPRTRDDIGRWFAGVALCDDGILYDFNVVRDDLASDGEFVDLFDRLATQRELTLDQAKDLLVHFALRLDGDYGHGRTLYVLP